MAVEITAESQFDLAVPSQGASSKDLIHGQPPARQSRLGVGDIARAEDRWMIGRPSVERTDGAGLGIDVPDNSSACLEVIGALGGHVGLGRNAVVALAADLDGELGR